MAQSALDRAAERGGWELIDAAGLGAFLERAGPNVLFFAADSSKRPETDDLAVIVPELQKTFANAFRVGLVRGEAIEALKSRFDVRALPCLVLLHGAMPHAALSRLQNWADYRAKFAAFLDAPSQEAGHV